MIAGRVPRHGSQGVRAVGKRRRVPVHAVRRVGAFRAQVGAVEFELHTRHADVIRGIGRHRHRGAGNRCPVGRRGDGDSGRGRVGRRATGACQDNMVH